MQEEAKLRIVRNKEQEKTSHEKYQVLLDVDGTLLSFDKAGGSASGTHPLWRTGYRGELCRSTTI